MQREDARELLPDARDGFGKGVAQTGDHLKQRKVHVAELSAQQVTVRFSILSEYFFEVAEKFRQPFADKILGATFRRGPLLLVVEPAADRMVDIVRFGDPIGDGQLQLMRPDSPRFVLRRETE